MNVGIHSLRAALRGAPLFLLMVMLAFGGFAMAQIMIKRVIDAAGKAFCHHHPGDMGPADLSISHHLIDFIQFDGQTQLA